MGTETAETGFDQFGGWFHRAPSESNGFLGRRDALASVALPTGQRKHRFVGPRHGGILRNCVPFPGMLPFQKWISLRSSKAHSFWANGGEEAQRQGTVGQGRARVEGTALHEAIAQEEWEAAESGRAAPSLDGPGDVPRTNSDAPSRRHWLKAEHQREKRGLPFLGYENRSDSGAWDHAGGEDAVPESVKGRLTSINYRQLMEQQSEPMAMRKSEEGFTLIELSIALVIIALIAGGVMVGSELVIVAQLRSTVSQIQHYRQAMEAFRLKYGDLPGDVPAQKAASFGFNTYDLNGTRGRRDGNGIIESAGITADYGTSVVSGELAHFWRDLSKAGMISETFLDINQVHYAATSSNWWDILPKSRSGRGNAVYIWSDGNSNYFGISVATWVNTMYFYSQSGFKAGQSRQNS